MLCAGSTRDVSSRLEPYDFVTNGDLKVYDVSLTYRTYFPDTAVPRDIILRMTWKYKRSSYLVLML